MFADRIPGTVRNAGEARAASLVARFHRQTRDVSSPVSMLVSNVAAFIPHPPIQSELVIP